MTQSKQHTLTYRVAYSYLKDECDIYIIHKIYQQS